MNFLKTLFWVVLAVAIALFAKANWTSATLKLWGGLEADVKLPILILAAFLIGFLPTFAYYRTRIWTLHRRLGNYERAGPVEMTAPTPSKTPTPSQDPGAPTAPAAPPPSSTDVGPVI